MTRLHQHSPASKRKDQIAAGVDLERCACGLLRSNSGRVHSAWWNPSEYPDAPKWEPLEAVSA